MLISRIERILDPICLSTCSNDKHFKIWSLSGVVWADVNLARFDDRVW